MNESDNKPGSIGVDSVPQELEDASFWRRSLYHFFAIFIGETRSLSLFIRNKKP